MTFILLSISIFLINGKGTEIRTQVLNKSEYNLTLRISLNRLYYGIKDYEGKNYLYFDLKNIGISEKIGDPELPVLRKLIEIPEGAEVSYRILNLKEETISLKDLSLPPVKPRLPPVVKIKGAKEKFVINKKTYSLDKFIPEENIEIKEIGKLREHRLAHLVFYPVKYNPARNEIKVISEIEISIEFKGGLRGNENYIKDNDVIKSILKEHILNYNPELYKSLPPLPIGMVIIYPDEWENYILPLVNWKKAKGYYIKLAPLSVTGYDTISIRNYIINLYNTWDKNLTFVILVGDVDKIPYFKSSEADNPANDLKYGLIDNNDYIPDLYVGRISVIDTNELKNVINKTLNHEKVIWTNGFDWAQKAFFIASADPSYHGVAEGTHLYSMQIVRNHGMIADSLFAYYQSGAPTIITNTLNDGRALCTYSGHGTDNGWADYGDLQFYNSDVYNLSNSSKLPFLQTYACLTGAYATNIECFMEAWIRAPDKGAVASFGSSVYSYWDEDDILQRRIFDETFDSGYVWVGGLITEGKIELLNYYGNTSTVHRYFQMYNLFGDPSLVLFTNIPDSLTVSYPLTVPMGNVQVNVSVSDNSGPVENALVSALQNDSILDVQYTDAGGNATLNLFINLTDTIFLTVTSYNHKPFQGFILVNPSGPYVSYYKSEISDLNGNSNGRINPGEEITLFTWVKNWGNDTAYNVSGLLHTGDSLITLIDTTDLYGDVNPGDTVKGQNGFIFTVPQYIPHNYTINFSLLTLSPPDTWQSNFSLKVSSTDLELLDYAIDDSLGNGNGIFEPDEQVVLFISVKNSGGEISENTSAKIISLSNYVQAIDSMSALGNINPGDSTTNTSDPFILYADPQTPTGYIANLKVILSSQYEKDTFDIQLTIGKKHYFVWDPDPNHSSGPVIDQILTNLGYVGDYDISLNSFDPNLYSALFICTGIYSNNYIILNGSQEAQTIVDFANNYGGRIYLEGGDIWYWDPQYENGYDFGPMFGITALDDGSGDLTPIQGQSGTFTQGMYFTSYSGENAWIDHIQASGTGAFNIFYDTDNSYYCGVARNAGTYKTVGMSFELAGLDDATDPSTKSALLDSIMHFFGINPVGIKEKQTKSTPRQTIFIGAFPSIIKNSSTLLFTLSKSQKITIEIKDITGRTLQKLISRKLPAGEYKIKWRPVNSRNRPLKSGVYFIRFDSEVKKDMKKIIILR